MSVDGIRPFPWQGGYDVSSLSLSRSLRTATTQAQKPGRAVFSPRKKGASLSWRN